MNCTAADRGACLYTVPGTEFDMDVDVFNGTIDELRKGWPFAEKPKGYSSSGRS
jgi:hypothetical protein